MDHTETVAIRYCLQHLSYNLSSFILGETDLLLDCFEQFDAGAELRDQEVIDFVLENFENLEDIGMVEFSQDAELGLEKLLLHCIHPFLLDDLDGTDLLAESSLALAYLSEGTLT